MDKPITLFGKILGSKKDYYVATTNVYGGEDEGGEGGGADQEAKGTGVNKQTFWVTNDVFADWTELPQISPRDIREARRIKHIFTGRLNAKIYSSPPFSKTEKYLLKAQLARIVYCTTLYPKDQWKIPEEGEAPFLDLEQVEEEVLVKPTNKSLSNLKNWVHYWPHILNCGRITHVDNNQIEEEEEKEKFMKALRLKDPFEKRLKLISDDKAPNGVISAWNVRRYGDQAYYPSNSKTKKPYVCHGSTIIESLIWPGFKLAIHNGRYFTFYLGYGQKFGTNLHYRTLVHQVMKEPEEDPCQYEPHPKEEPEKKEEKAPEE